MPTNRYWGEDVTLTIEIGGTSITAGKAKSIAIDLSAEHADLFTPESLTRADVKRREVTVPVSLELVEWNEEIIQYWLGGDGTTSQTINETSEVAQFEVTAELNMTDHTGTTGDESIKAVVTGVDFEDLPVIPADEGEYSQMSLDGTGEGITVTKETVA